MKFFKRLNFFKRHRGFLLILIGIIIIYHGKAPLDFFLQSKNWPYTQGKVLHAKVIESEKNEIKIFHPGIIYEYSVSGENYKSNGISYKNPSFKTEEAAKQVLDKYQREKTFRVFYNPDNPKQAFLNISLGFNSIIGLFVGIGAAMIGLLSFIMAKMLRRILISGILLNSGIILVWNSSGDFSFFNSIKLIFGGLITILGYKYLKPVFPAIKSHLNSKKNF